MTSPLSPSCTQAQRTTASSASPVPTPPQQEAMTIDTPRQSAPAAALCGPGSRRRSSAVPGGVRAGPCGGGAGLREAGPVWMDVDTGSQVRGGGWLGRALLHDSSKRLRSDCPVPTCRWLAGWQGVGDRRLPSTLRLQQTPSAWPNPAAAFACARSSSQRKRPASRQVRAGRSTHMGGGFEGGWVDAWGVGGGG